VALYQILFDFTFYLFYSASARRCARRSTSFSARLLRSSRQICGRLTTPITVQLTTKSGESASLDKSAQDVDDLRQRRIDVLTGIQQSVIYNAVEWHRRIRTCIQARGGHFEYSR